MFLCDTNAANMSACECGCEHYVRSCLLKAPCCGKFYVCRLCHDDVEDHQMDRFRVTEVKCSICDTVQQSQQTCEKCSVTFGEYYCSICHLFDKDKKQYHCLPCGICRIGPKENYFHCEKCNLCLASNLRGNHKCVPDVSRQNCPVCMEDIHTSRTGAHVLPCGHLLHQTCFDYMHKMGGYRCPLCMHSAWNMKHCWEEMDREISETPMPSEYQGVTVKVICMDCQARSTVPFHVLGMKCSGCGSYNTTQDGGLIRRRPGEGDPGQAGGGDPGQAGGGDPGQAGGGDSGQAGGGDSGQVGGGDPGQAGGGDPWQAGGGVPGQAGGGVPGQAGEGVPEQAGEGETRGRQSHQSD